MSYTSENGYLPLTFNEIMDGIRVGINTQLGTSYTDITFVGTGWYKYMYSLVQKVQENEIKTSEVFLHLQEYINIVNLRIQRPSVSQPGLIESFGANGFLVSLKPMIDVDAGKISICVDLDNALPGYASQKLAACTLVKDFVAAGIVSQGTEIEAITLTNGQTFDFKFFLPDRIPVLLRLSAVESQNTLLPEPDDQVIRQALFDSINAKYRLGLDFEPQRYFSLVDDIPWAQSIVLEWSDDAGANWHDEVFEANFDELFTFELGDISVIFT